MTKDKEPKPSEILLYTSPLGDVKVEVFFKDETVWLTQKKIAELFGVVVPTVNEHLQNIFQSGELDKTSVIRKFRSTATDGKSYETQFYNLDAIISVGYRVSSEKATRFRIWATKTLKGFIIKGFVMDDERLKQGSKWGKDYFDELLERIREIRSSERRFYQRITDIYADTSIDYDPSSKTTKDFYATVQNKLHWAITGKTAAQIISERSSAKKPHMGLTTWKRGPKGKILKTDVSIAKNYLAEKELKDLNLIVNMYLDYAELQARKQVPMKMSDWVTKLDGFLKFNEYTVLNDAGKVSAEVAKNLAEAEYEKYRVTQDRAYTSDFDQSVEKYLKNPDKPKKKK